MITFDGQVLSNASTFDDDPGIQIKKTKLYNGKQRIDASPETVFEPTFTCYTEDYSEITNIRSKIGLPKTLVIDGVSYLKCYIDNPFKQKMYSPGKWTYTISFTQDTR